MAFNLEEFIVGEAPQTAPRAEFNLDDFIVDAGPQTTNLVSNSGRWTVEDGDTIIDNRSGEVFRLEGMNTPETVHLDKGWNSAEYGAAEATKRTLDFINQAETTGDLQLETGGKDAYGRTLARIPGHVEEMLRTGAASFEGRAPEPGLDQARLQRMFAENPAGIPPESAEAAGQRLDQTLRTRAQRRPTEYLSGGNFVTRSVERGIDQTAELVGSAGEALGQLTGWEGLEQSGRDLAARKEAEARANPAEVPTWEDVHGLGDFGVYALERVGEQAANLALMAAGGGIGGAIAKRGAAAAIQGLTAKEAAKVLATRGTLGRIGGAAAGTYTQAVGDIQSELSAAGIKAPGSAFLWGIPYAGAEALSFEFMLGRFFGETAKPVAKNMVRAIAKEAGKAIGLSAGSEATTEYAQELMVLTARAMQDPTFEIFSEQNLKRLKEAAIAGGVVGGAFGGLGGAAHGVNYEKPFALTPPPREGDPLPIPPDEPPLEPPVNPADFGQGRFDLTGGGMNTAPNTSAMPDGRPVPPPTDEEQAAIDWNNQAINAEQDRRWGRTERGVSPASVDEGRMDLYTADQIAEATRRADELSKVIRDTDDYDRTLVNQKEEALVVANSRKPIGWLIRETAKKVHRANEVMAGRLFPKKHGRYDSDLAQTIMSEARAFANLINRRNGMTVATEWTEENLPRVTREQSAPQATPQVAPQATPQGNAAPSAWYDALPDDLEVEMDVTAADTGEVHRAKLPAKQTAMELEQTREAYSLLRACLSR